MGVNDFLKQYKTNFKDNINLLDEKEHFVFLIEQDYEQENNAELKRIKRLLTYSVYVELIGFLLYNSLELEDCKSAGQVFKKVNHPYLEGVDHKIRNSFQHLDFKLDKEFYCKTKEGFRKVSEEEIVVKLEEIKIKYEELKKRLAF